MSQIIPGQTKLFEPFIIELTVQSSPNYRWGGYFSILSFRDPSSLNTYRQGRRGHAELPTSIIENCVVCNLIDYPHYIGSDNSPGPKITTYLSVSVAENEIVQGGCGIECRIKVRWLGFFVFVSDRFDSMIANILFIIIIIIYFYL